ncbi:MAG: hypothetical protein LQ337_008902 [Flavoplaca oasis]|nr:MAG: hypothetical protein LQ337_008902 [Flavoplaca oasis]
MEFRYKPLPTPTSIRLLKFDPDNYVELLPCSFIVVDITAAPEYIALSYVWGDATNRIPISIGGQIIQVTRNLRDALQKFRNTPALLWADALCINQQDMSEKNVQVNMMSNIYLKAACVAVWLGPDEHGDADDIFEDIKAIVDFTSLVIEAHGQFGHFDENTGDLYWQLENKKDIVSALPAAIVRSDDEDKGRLERFLRLPYWSRTWVLQEVGLASEAVVLWGDQAFQWNPVGLFAMFLHRHCKALFIRLGLLAELEKLVHVYLAFSPFRPMSTFLHIINNSRRFKATDQRDKVFALLSHSTAHTISMTTVSLNWHAYRPAAITAARLTPSIHEQLILKNLLETREKSYTPPKELPPPFLQADYSKTTDEVYLALAMNHIKRAESLEILAAVQHNPTAPEELFSPSWVPRWDYFVDTPIFGFYMSDNIASANKKPIITPVPPGAKSLIVRGLLLTRITFHTDILEPSCFDLAAPSNTADTLTFWKQNPIAETWVKRLADLDPESYPVLPTLSCSSDTGLYAMFDTRATNVYDAFMRTWVAGFNTGEQDGDSFMLERYTKAYWERLTWGSVGFSASTLSQIRLSPGKQRAQELNNQRDWQRYRDVAAYVCNKRKFFITKKGFFGIGPGALKQGDFVAVLLGADVPFVIREVFHEREMNLEERMRLNQPVPMDSKFQLVGECYVQGLMGGQATNGVEITRDITLI